MGKPLTRRDFLKLAALGSAGLAFTRLPQGMSTRLNNQILHLDADNLGRVSTHSVSIYSKPDDTSTILYQRFRDELVNLYYAVISDAGPSWNPLWYRVWGGYVHSQHVVQVDNKLNPVLDKVPDKGQLGEITVPWTQSYRHLPRDQWDPIYRLYYGSYHWITGIETGADGQPWYKLKDELLKIEYDVPAAQVRPVPPEEFAPISPDVPADKKHIYVSLDKQELTAYEGDKVVLHTKISSGLPDHNEWPNTLQTPTGTFHIESKQPSKHMGDGNVTSNPEAYEIPGVPWVSFFVPDKGIAFHGTFWHNNFGVPMSHGCVNMRTEEARFIFNWSTPVTSPDLVNKNGYGTVVTVS